MKIVFNLGVAAIALLFGISPVVAASVASDRHWSTNHLAQLPAELQSRVLLLQRACGSEISAQHYFSTSIEIGGGKFSRPSLPESQLPKQTTYLSCKRLFARDLSARKWDLRKDLRLIRRGYTNGKRFRNSIDQGYARRPNADISMDRTHVRSGTLIKPSLPNCSTNFSSGGQDRSRCFHKCPSCSSAHPRRYS